MRLYFWMTFDLVVEPELLAAARGLMKTGISLSILQAYHSLFKSKSIHQIGWRITGKENLIHLLLFLLAIMASLI